MLEELGHHDMTALDKSYTMLGIVRLVHIQRLLDPGTRGIDDCSSADV